MTLLPAWLWRRDENLVAGLQGLPIVELGAMSITWFEASLVLALCIVISWTIFVCVRARAGRARCMFRLRAGIQNNLQEPLLSTEVDVRPSQAPASSFKELRAYVPRTADANATCDYRREFLLFGLGHGVLAFVRELWLRDSLPHAWGILQTDATKEWGQANFRRYLVERGLRAGGHRTVFDAPFLEYDWYSSLSLTLQAVFLFLMLLTSEICSWNDISRGWSFLGAAVAVASAVSILIPNYAQMTQLPQYFNHCGQDFDAFMQFLVSGVLGMLFAVPLGLQVFGLLVAIPIAAVRGIWFVMAWGGMGSHMRHVLQAAMWLLASLIPFVTIFPLMFFNQLAEDVESHHILLAFWWVPSLLIAYKSAETHETWFYFMWLAAYIGLFTYFLWRQALLFNIDIQTVVADLDIPWLWSVMHANFCFTNVVITDLIRKVLPDSPANRPETMEPSQPPSPRVQEQDIPLVALALPCPAVQSAGEFGMIGLVEARSVAGVSVLKFQSEAHMQQASRQAGVFRDIVPLTSLISVKVPHFDNIEAS